MSFNEIPALALQLEQTDPSDRAAQRKLVRHVRSIRDRVREEDASDLAFCLNAIANLAAVMALPGGRIAGQRLQQLAIEILEAMQPALHEHGVGNAPDAQPRPATPSAGTVDDKAAAEIEAEGGTTGLKLGQMLIEFGHATKDDVAAALKMQENLGLPIGECLLLSGAASPDHLLSALRLQEKLRGAADGAGVGGTADAEGAEDDLDRADLRVTQEMFLGEALLGAGMISEEDLEQAMHIHHHEDVRIGDALLRIDALTREELETGIELHARLRRIATLSSADAAARTRSA